LIASSNFLLISGILDNYLNSFKIIRAAEIPGGVKVFKCSLYALILLINISLVSLSDYKALLFISFNTSSTKADLPSNGRRSL
jgi:hypothetical protein